MAQYRFMWNEEQYVLIKERSVPSPPAGFSRVRPLEAFMILEQVQLTSQRSDDTPLWVWSAHRWLHWEPRFVSLFRRSWWGSTVTDGPPTIHAHALGPNQPDPPQLKPDEHSTTVIPPPLDELRLIQAQDIHFGNERAIFLPAPPTRISDKGNSGGVTGLSVARAALRHAWETGEKLVIFGHSDASGSSEVNDTIAMARATNVRLFLEGDRSGWASHSFGHYAVDDVQTLLLWSSIVWGWSTDPGPIDNTLGPSTQSALEEFRRDYNFEWEALIPVQGPLSQADWEAFFDVCDATLSDMLGPRLPTLCEHRDALEVYLLKACGEDWPHRKTKASGYPKGGDRRVDLMFLDDTQLHLASPAAVYGSSSVTIIPLQPEPAPFNNAWISFELRDPDGQAMAQEPYQIRDPGGTIVTEGRLDNNGRIRVSRIPFSSCHIVFPDLGADAWGELLP